MLSTGIKTPVGIKVAGPDLAVLQGLGEQIEATLRELPGTMSAYAERVVGGNYLDFEIDREETRSRGWSATPSTCATAASSGTICPRCGGSWS
jgi:Cu(I)/Ag(I) efflux system membrane protein CusA/SilA